MLSVGLLELAFYDADSRTQLPAELSEAGGWEERKGGCFVFVSVEPRIVVAGSPVNIHSPSRGDARAACGNTRRGLRCAQTSCVMIRRMGGGYKSVALSDGPFALPALRAKSAAHTRSSCAQPTSALCLEVSAYRVAPMSPLSDGRRIGFEGPDGLF